MNQHVIIQHLMDSWLSGTELWEFAFFQELFTLSRAVQNLPCVLSNDDNDDDDDVDDDGDDDGGGGYDGEEYQVEEGRLSLS